MLRGVHAVRIQGVILKIKIHKTSKGLYSAELFSLMFDQPEWRTTAPANAPELARELLELGLPLGEIGDAFEEADPNLVASPHSQHIPKVGEEVYVTNYLGSFLVEGVDAEAKTAGLRVLRSGVLLNDVAWTTIWRSMSFFGNFDMAQNLRVRTLGPSPRDWFRERLRSRTRFGRNQKIMHRSGDGTARLHNRGVETPPQQWVSATRLTQKCRTKRYTPATSALRPNSN